MKITVIIPTIGRTELHDTLASLRAQTREPDEIVVMHDDMRRGAAATRNQAVRDAHGDVLLFIDDDCIAAPTWVERMEAAFLDPHTTAAAGSVIYQADTDARAPDERVVQNPDARWFMGANCAVRRDAFWKIGGFPEKYRVYEDKAFALACLTHGYHIARVPTASVYHARSQWDKRKVKDFADHLSWWVDLMADYNVWLDAENPPPVWGPVLMPRDYISFLKHAARFYSGASRLRAELLARQRINLWRHAIKRKKFII